MYKHIIYSDTDSCYATVGAIVAAHPERNVVELADEIGESINASFPDFVKENFLVQDEYTGVVEAGREVVATRGLFKDQKKRYALHVIDKEGVATDEMKVMGMETRRSDTPKFIQEFLEQCLTMLVRDGADYSTLKAKANEFRENVFNQRDPWRRGSPQRVSKLTINAKKTENYEKATQEGYVGLKKPPNLYAVNAAINTNRLMAHYGEKRWDVIRDGDKVEILALLDNPWDMKTVAIKVGETYVPQWFKDLPFDTKIQEDKLLTKKLFNTIGSVLGWDFTPPTSYADEIMEEEDFFSN